MLEAKPAEINRAPGLTASDLLFANVKQNTINKTAIESGQNKPIQKRLRAYQYKPRPRSAGRAEKLLKLNNCPFSLMSAGTARYRLFKRSVWRNVTVYSF